jgi:hypothetical protein
LTYIAGAKDHIDPRKGTASGLVTLVIGLCRKGESMKPTKPFSRPIAVRVFVFMFLAFMAVGGGAYWIVGSVGPRILMLKQHYPEIAEIQMVARHFQTIETYFWSYVIPAVFLFFVLLGLVMWLVLRRAVDRRFKQLAASTAPAAKAVKAKPPEQDKSLQQRTYLHWLTLLQREGRLIDFFSEDLNQYADAQIGAAVRNIHENCKKTMDKYLVPRAVLDQNEGTEITVEADFDPNALKLIGNVTGAPPFKGIVRHRGWRAGKIEVPAFSGQQDPAIIAPAEIEVR